MKLLPRPAALARKDKEKAALLATNVTFTSRRKRRTQVKTMGFIPEMVELTLKVMVFILKLMVFILKLMVFILKVMVFILNLIDFRGVRWGGVPE